MAYFLADSTGYLTDFASIGGLADFSAWAQYQPKELKDFLRNGHTKNPQALAAALGEINHVDSNVHEQYAALRVYAQAAKDVLIVSDGIDDSEQEALRAAAAKKSPILTVADSVVRRLELDVAVGLAVCARVYKKDGLESALSALEKSLLRDLPKDLARTHTLGQAATILSPRLRTNAVKTKMKFDSKNERAVEWAEKHAGELVQGVSKATRELIRDAVAKHGAEADEVISGLINDPDRAQLIARTESIRAANEGQLSAWEDARAEGLLDDSSKRVWIATGDDLTCPICEPMDGVEASFDDPFFLDNGDAVMVPPAHPRCRCTVGLA